MQWSEFPIKTNIVFYLDYASRCSLRACSKHDLAAVDATPFVADEISIHELPGNLDSQKSNIRVRIDTFTIWFVGKNDVTRVERSVNGNELEWAETLHEKRHDVSRRFLDKFVKGGKFHAKRITIESKNILPSEHWNLKCDYLKLTSLGQSEVWAATWIGKVTSRLKTLEVFSWNVLGLSELAQISTVSERLRIEDLSDLTDEQLDRIPANHLQITSKCISLEGVKRAVARFLRKGKREDDLNLSFNFPSGFEVRDLFPAGVVLRKLDTKPPPYGVYKIVGGFENENGFNDVRDFFFNYSNILIQGSPPQKKKFQCLLYPFTAN